MDPSSFVSTFNVSTTFTPRIWSGILNHYSKIEDLHRRLEVVRNLKRKLAYEASRFAAQREPFPISTMFLNDFTPLPSLAFGDKDTLPTCPYIQIKERLFGKGEPSSGAAMFDAEHHPTAELDQDGWGIFL
ncbi:hypothetical protein L6452_44441 [Arctium lappa]|uniref:Uncharacterized protein n=1 Tax=Arctium lappa TaxID=4217 RepID=A0ACB8XG66_ARCLA|nr:hypothetical protein L6452_44441 [Arctium lappa]